MTSYLLLLRYKRTAYYITIVDTIITNLKPRKHSLLTITNYGHTTATLYFKLIKLMKGKENTHSKN